MKSRNLTSIGLAPTSPCIDAGINATWMLGAHDLDGGPRIRKGKAGIVDLGAYGSKYAPMP